MTNNYRLKGYDLFSGDYYDLGGEYSIREECIRFFRGHADFQRYKMASVTYFERKQPD